MPAVAMFYHLIHAGLTDTAQMLLARATGQGWRVMIRCPDPGLAHRLDEMLWLPEDSFLPHGRATGGPEDCRQPVLIGPGAAVNGARGLMLVAGAEFTPADLPGLDRLWILFDGGDAEAVNRARAQWSLATGMGLAAQYWSDEAGAWVKKSERPATQPA